MSLNLIENKIIKQINNVSNPLQELFIKFWGSIQREKEELTQADAGILIAKRCRSQDRSGLGSTKECERNCSASSSSNSLHHVTRFETPQPGPKHLQRIKRYMIQSGFHIIDQRSFYTCQTKSKSDPVFKNRSEHQLSYIQVKQSA